MSTSAPPPPFTAQELTIMRGLLAANDPIPAHEPGAMGRKAHVTYCFSQMARFCHLAQSGAEPFRDAQFGLALGRVQELLGCVGGKTAWWQAFEPLLISRDYAAISAITRSYIDVLGLEPPSDAFLNKR